jgi:hypothetical protein
MIDPVQKSGILHGCNSKIGENGKRWVFTDFGVEIWGKTDGDEESLVLSGNRNDSQSGS